MNLFMEYWPYLVAVILAVIMTIVAVCKFVKSDRDEQIEMVKKWLLWAVTVAEKELGSGTGKLKLVNVYNMFINTFPYLVSLITFEKFSKLVDDVLDEMNEMLASNNAINSYVKGDDVK